MATTPAPSPCMVAHHEQVKNRFRDINYAALLYNKLSYGEPIMSISIDQSGMGLAALFKGVYQVRAIGSGAVTPPSVFSHTVPSSMTIGMDYQVSFSGVTSSQGTVTYTISTPVSLGSMGSFSKAAGINAGENITVSWHASTGGGAHDMAVPGNYSFEVRAYAGQTLVATNTVNFTLAAASVAVNVGDVFKTTLYNGNTVAVTINNGVNMRDYNGLGIFKAINTAAPAVATFGDMASNQYLGLASQAGISSTGGSAPIFERLVDGYRVYPIDGSSNSSSTQYVNWSFRQHIELLHTGVHSHTEGTASTINLNLVNPGAAILTDSGGGPKYFFCNGMNGTQYMPLDDEVSSTASAATTLWTFSGSQLILSPAFPTGNYEFVVFNNGIGSNAIIKCGLFTATNTPVAVDLGFEIGWLLYREFSHSTSSGWKIIDDVRGMEGTNKELTFEPITERTFPAFIDPTPIGFTVAPAMDYNRATGGYVYIAIKKDPNAVTSPVLSGSHDWSAWPISINAGETKTVSISGVTTSLGTVFYSLTLPAGMTASKTTGIISGESFTITAGSGMSSGLVPVTATAESQPGAGTLRISTYQIQVVGAVTAPTMSGSISLSMPSQVTAGNNYNVSISGKSASSGTVVYGINVTSGSQYVTFSKTSGIAAGETVTMSVASNAPNGGGIAGIVSANTTPVAASNPDNIGFNVSTLAIVEPDPTLNGFNHTVPANVDAGGSYTVTFSGTSSSNGNQVWYSLSPQSGLSFSKLDNISSGEAVTMTVSGSASGTLGVTVYANTTKNNGSTFTQNKAYIQTAVVVPVTVDMNHLTMTINQIGTGPGGQHWEGAFTISVSGAVASDGREIRLYLTDSSWSISYIETLMQGVTTPFTWPSYNNSVYGLTVVAKDSGGVRYASKSVDSHFGLIGNMWPSGQVFPVTVSK